MEADVADTRPKCYICGKHPLTGRLAPAGTHQKMICDWCYFGYEDADDTVDELVAADLRNGHK